MRHTVSLINLSMQKAHELVYIIWIIYRHPRIGTSVTRLPLPNKIAYVMSPRLGDTLIFMVTANNLHLNGFPIQIFSDFLYTLRDWFPGLDIHPYPAIDQVHTTLAKFDLILHNFAPDWLLTPENEDLNLWRLDYEKLFYNRKLPLIDIQLIACKKLLGLKKIVRDNGLVVPTGLHFQRHHRRVAVHPTASTVNKYWLPERFIELAQHLRKKGFDPVFVVSPHEIEQVPWVAQHGFPLFTPHSIIDLASWLYESGWFIGNDSGIGHLASNLGIPTLSLMPRKSVRNYWRPAFTQGEVLFPNIPLIFTPLKLRYWRHLISVRRVLKTFERMNNRYAPAE